MKVSQKIRVINPSGPVWLEGGATRKEKAIGIYSDVKTMALYLEINEKRLIFCTVDAIAFEVKDIEYLKEEISNKTKICNESIFIVATHTHSAPAVRLNENRLLENADHKAFIFSQVIAVCVDSLEDVVECEAYYQKKEVLGYYGNRDSIEKEGDQQVTLIRFVKDNQIVAALFHLHVHPTFLDQNYLLVSSDIAGSLRHHMQTQIGIEPVFACGITGDMSSRFYRKDQSYFELERTGKKITQEILTAPLVKLEINRLEMDEVIYKIRRELLMSDHYAKYESYLKQKETETNPIELRLLETKIKRTKALIDNKVTKIESDWVTNIIDFGDLCFVTFNNDPVVSFGKQIKKANQSKLCLTFSHVNGEEGYLVEKQDFNTGYIGNVTKALPGQAEEYIESIAFKVSQLR